MAVRPSVKRTKIDMTSLKIYLRGEKKTGKSTLFRDLILEKFGDAENGLLIGFGAEVGYELLDNLNSVQVENYADFKELLNWLVTQKGKEHDIKMVALDTADEWISSILEPEVCRQSTIETKKPCKSINSAFSGFGAGQERLKMLMKNSLVQLSKAGITPFVISHTKVKTVKEKGQTEEEGYNVLTGNIQANYDSLLSEILDVCCILRVDKDIKDGRVQSAVRKLHFRNDGFCDCGSRFANGAVPDYIVFDGDDTAKLFIDTLEEGMRKSLKTTISNEELAKRKAEEIANREAMAKDFIDNVASIDVELNAKYIDEIKVLFAGAIDTKKNKVRELMTSNGITKFDVETNKTSVLAEILAVLKA